MRGALVYHLELPSICNVATDEEAVKAIESTEMSRLRLLGTLP